MFKTLQFPIIAAPMAGITDEPFRRILRKLNPDMPIETEMISCHSITQKHKPSDKRDRNSDTYFGDNIGAQIFGADPKLMAEAAKILEQNGAAWIDLNMGCPVPKVATRAGAGAFLMRDHKLAGEIMAAVVHAVKIPVSVKTRLGWDEQHINVSDLVKVAENSGINFITVHARTRSQGYSGKARWTEIPKSKLPVIFNGDIKTTVDIESAKKLGANGAMIGRALMGNPWLFNKDTVGRAETILEHLDLTLEYYGNSGVQLFRKHAAWYAVGRPGVAQFRGQVNQITDATEMKKVISEFFVL